MEPILLTEEQIGGLTEVANVGIGNATANLSQLLRRRCLIEIPKIAPMDDGVRALLASPESFLVHLQIKIAAQTPASIFIVMAKTDAHNILAAVPKDALPAAGGGEGGLRTAQSVLRHVAEIMAEAFFDGLSQLLMNKGRYSLPAITVSSASAPMEMVLQSLRREEGERLAIHSAFFDRDKTFRGKFVYLIGRDFLVVIFQWLNFVIGAEEKS